MEKEVLITIDGLQSLDGESDQVQVITPGEYYFQMGKHYLLYDEVAEDYTAVVKNMIKIQEGKIEIVKRGPLKAFMAFEEGKQNSGYYDTPFGRLQIGIWAERIQVQEETDRLTVQIAYSLQMNEQFVSECSIKLSVAPRSSIKL